MLSKVIGQFSMTFTHNLNAHNARKCDQKVYSQDINNACVHTIREISAKLSFCEQNKCHAVLNIVWVCVHTSQRNMMAMENSKEAL